MTGSYNRQDVRNEISGRLHFSTVVQGAQVTLQLPSALPPSLTGMPAAHPTFTGRESETSTLLEAMRHAPETTGTKHVISGLPGVGKTELALQVAHRALGTPGLLPGGVLFIDLFGYDERRRISPHRALGSLLRSLAVPDEYVPEGMADRERLYRSVLATYAAEQRRILLVLDNAMDSAQVRPLLPGDARIPALITTRHTLSDLGARMLNLSVLEQQDAVKFVARSLHGLVGPEDTRVADEPTAADEIASLCGGLPLALSIVGSLLADVPSRPLRSMANALSDAHRRLERLSREDLAVRAVFDLSYRHLRPDQARLFRLLPLNPGPDLATETVAQLADMASDDAEGLLLLLVRGHFIEPGSSFGRWRMHDLMRLYADELCHAEDAPHEREAALERLFVHYVTTTHAADTHMDAGSAPDPLFPDRDAALAWLDAEHANLLAAAVTGPQTGRPEVLLQLHYSLIDYQRWRRSFEECVALALAALETIRALSDPLIESAEASVLNNLATAQRELRRFDDAVASYREAQRLQQENGDSNAVAATLNNLGLAYQQMNLPNEAVSVLRQALALYTPVTDRRLVGMTHTNLGKALHSLRRLPEAAEAFTEDIAICRATGDRSGEGVALNNLGMVLRDMGDLLGALDAHEHALAAARETKDLYSEGLAESNIGLALAMNRDARGPQEAIRRLTHGLDIMDSLGDEHMVTQAQNHLGLILIQAGQPDRAIDPLKSAVEGSRRTGDPHTEAMTLTNLGTALELSGRYADAVQNQSAAVALYRRLGERHHEARALLNLGLAVLRTGDPAAAHIAFGESAAAFRETGDTELVAHALRLQEQSRRMRQ
ncbi:tetratricopeptide repeat protein [Streptomyces sp. NBC_00825]|uniref:tetratricopeptide repeat protein n=1 Tax=unclassified Streptomyces TaxID=2593676 RepID=UPI0022505F01|nr:MULTISPECIES: tetratricopeptide repeat protein [unclassified Streptomyces]WTB55894.1 tetratricopeptide repeat protein [Streptomyces sp. NBC_00826]WTH91224.1 tetratricopeptide repeat protein [Streptomyces sp. NBC_00825]WTH99950.1 tetratricopeptide repeat protein [Streptomyces sp. NBC_00822]MCX4865424.1 tetratricopeptide repeat protein [Streptomyces sp. NBC_00906]MCX4896662.1 tetratricopeptide repeat protein [Streptomyces sp. NBC_00892]